MAPSSLPHLQDEKSDSALVFGLLEECVMIKERLSSMSCILERLKEDIILFGLLEEWVMSEEWLSSMRRILERLQEGIVLFVKERPRARSKGSPSSRLIAVYVKNRDPFVKQSLATQLYNTLDLLGLREFLDAHLNELGNSFPSIIKIAIHSVKVHMAILSKRSRLFVDLLKMAELVHMLESNCERIPMFYHEEPQKLRHSNCQMYNYPVGLHNQVKEFKRGRFGQLLQDLEKQCTLQGKKRRKP